MSEKDFKKELDDTVNLANKTLDSMNKARLAIFIKICGIIGLISAMAVFPYMKPWVQLATTIIIFVGFILLIIGYIVQLWMIHKKAVYVKNAKKMFKTFQMLDNFKETDEDDIINEFNNLMKEE